MLVKSQQEPWLDIHVLISRQTNPTWVLQCLTSIKEALFCAGFPVQVHLLDAVMGHIGRARARGFSRGSAPYITQIDEDDYISADGLSQLREALLANPDAIFPQEMILQYEWVDGELAMHPLEPGRQRHSMKVFKREHLIDFQQWSWAGDTAELCYLEKQCKHLIDIPCPTYFYRVYADSNSRPLRFQDPQQLTMARLGTAELLQLTRQDS